MPVTADLRTCVFNKTLNANYNLNGVKCRETIDLEVLELLLQSDLVSTTKWTAEEWGFNQQLENERQQLMLVRDSIMNCKSKNKYNTVTYYNNKSYGIDFGRVYPYKSLGLCAIRREIRHTLAGQHYYDIDMENAHPNIISQICRTNDLPCKALNTYVNNREDCLKKIMSVYGVDRGAAKNLIIRLCYGGEFETWIKDNEVFHNTDVLDWVDDIKNELREFANVVWDRNPDLHNLVEQKDEHKRLRSLLSTYTQNIENQILCIMYEFCVAKKLIKKDRQKFYDCVLCFDGIMIPKINVTKDINEVLDELRAYVKKHTRFDIPFTSKPMDEGYRMSDIENAIENDDTILETMNKTDFMTSPFSLSDTEKMFENVKHKPLVYFALKKKYLEHGPLQLAQVGTNVCFVLNGEVYTETEDKVKKMLAPIQSGLVDVWGRPIQFMDVWQTKPEKRFHHKLDFYPHRIDEKAPSNIYNLFQGWNPVIQEENPFVGEEGKQNQMDILSDFFELVKAQCEDNDDIMDFFLKWFATRVQTPREKIPIAFIFFGKQGSGVSTMMRLLDCIFQKQQYIDTANVNDFFGNHAEGFFGKLHVNMNEISLEKSYQYTEAIKSAITEDEIRVNPKNIRPYDVYNYALLTFTTNNKDGLPIDVRSGDRRFTACTRSHRLNNVWGNSDWKRVRGLVDDADFVNALFWYLMELDFSNINWEKDRPMTELYADMVEINAPPIASFMEWFVCEKKFADYDETPGRCVVDEEDDTGIVLDVEYTQHEMYGEEVRVKTNNLYKCFKKWAETFNMYSKGVPSSKKFAKLLDTIERLQSKKIMGNRFYTFTPSVIMKELEEKKWIKSD